MDIDKIAPELRPEISRVPTLPYHNYLLPVWRLLLRLAGRTQLVDGVSVQEHSIGTVTVRIYRPKTKCSDASLLWIHGGGFVVGFAAQDDQICSNYAKELNLVVFSVEYRLAPKHPFPAALDDCYAVWRWLQDQSEKLGIDASRIAIGGQSAGGGLAACLAQRIVDDGRTQPVTQILFYPMLDDRTSADRNLDSIQHFVWNNENNRGGWSAYLGHEPGQLSEPTYSVAARREELVGLPPAWIGVGEVDLFYEENRQYAERLKVAGVLCEFEVVPMAPHGFNAIAPNAPISQKFHQNSSRYLRRMLGL